MRMSVRVLGCEVLAIEYGDPAERPQLESTAGGQFEFGFTGSGDVDTDDPAVTAAGSVPRIGRDSTTALER